MQKFFLLVALFAWMILFAITDHYLPWVSWHGEAMAYVALFFMWLSFSLQKSNSSKIYIPNIALLFLAVIAIAFVQLFFRKIIFPSDIILLCINVALIILAIVLGYKYGEKPPKNAYGGIGIFAAVILITALVLSVQAMIRAFDLDLLSEYISGVGAKRRPGSNLSQPNHLATFLNWGFVSLAYLHVAGKVKSIYFYLATLPLVFGIVLTESRTGLLALTFLCIIIGSLNPYGKSKKYGILGLWLGTSLLFMWWPEIWASIQIIDGAKSTINTSSSGRLALWCETLQAIAMHPLAGWGYRQFAWAHMSTFATIDAALIATYSHNLLLDLIVWFGLPLGFILIVWIVRWLFKQIQNVRTVEQKYALLFLMPFGLHSMLEYPYMFAYFLVPVGLCLGSLSALNNGVPKLQMVRSYFIGLYIVIFSVAAWSAYEYLKLEEDFRLARFASARVGSDPVDYQLTKTYLLHQVADLVSVVRENPSVGMTNEDIERARRVAIYYPWLGTLSKYAVILKINGREAEYIQIMQIIKVYFGEGAILRVHEKLQGLQASEVSK